MTDRDLAQALRDAHAGLPGIPFARVLAGARARAGRPSVSTARVAARLALAGAIAILLAAVFLPDSAPPAGGTRAEWSAPTDFLLTRSELESPTDFLLEGASP